MSPLVGMFPNTLVDLLIVLLFFRAVSIINSLSSGAIPANHYENASTNSAPKSKYVPPHLRGRGGGGNDNQIEEPPKNNQPTPLLKADFNAPDGRVNYLFQGEDKNESWSTLIPYPYCSLTLAVPVLFLLRLG